MLIITTWEISLLVEHVVSMHDETALKPDLRIQWWPFYSCQQQYGPLNQRFACWHTHQGPIPVCPPHISRTLLFWLAPLTKNMAAASHDSTDWSPDHCHSIDCVKWAVYPINISVPAYLCNFALALQLWENTLSKTTKTAKTPCVVFRNKPQENILLFSSHVFNTACSYP